MYLATFSGCVYITMTEDGVLQFQEKKGPIGTEKKYVYSKSAEAFVPLVKAQDGYDECLSVFIIIDKFSTSIRCSQLFLTGK